MNSWVMHDRLFIDSTDYVLLVYSSNVLETSCQVFL